MDGSRSWEKRFFSPPTSHQINLFSADVQKDRPNKVTAAAASVGVKERVEAATVNEAKKCNLITEICAKECPELTPDIPRVEELYSPTCRRRAENISAQE